MKVLVDSSVLIDLFTNDPHWADWSQQQLDRLFLQSKLLINPIIYSEISISFSRIEELEDLLGRAQFELEEIPREAQFLAGKAFLGYRRRKGPRKMVLPDFYIGAHAAVNGHVLLTRDPSRVKTYFPAVKIITP